MKCQPGLVKSEKKSSKAKNYQKILMDQTIIIKSEDRQDHVKKEHKRQKIGTQIVHRKLKIER